MARTLLTLLVVTLLASAALAQRAPTHTPAWVKLCDKGTLKAKDKDGKEQKKVLDVCVTGHERLDYIGMVIVGAYYYQCRVDGQEKQLFRVMVPTGIRTEAGMRLTFFPTDLWDKVARNETIEKSDEARLSTLKFDFQPCQPVGCAAEMEPTPDLLTGLKTSGGMMAFAIGPSETTVPFHVPLAGFAQALEGEPIRARMAHGRREWLQEAIMWCVEALRSKRP
jgi:invasion protein IalB